MRVSVERYQRSCAPPVHLTSSSRSPPTPIWRGKRGTSWENWSNSEKTAASPPLKLAPLKVSGATPVFSRLIVLNAVWPVRTYMSPSVSPGAGMVLALGTHASKPASIRSASVLVATGGVFHAPPSRLSRTVSVGASLE